MTAKAGRFTYWVTRDSDPETGAAYDRVKVWLAPPHRHALGRGAFWLGPALEADLYCESDLWWCFNNGHTWPDDDRQSIRVEGDRVKGPLDEVARDN